MSLKDAKNIIAGSAAESNDRVIHQMILNGVAVAFKWDPVICNLVALCFSGILNFSMNEFVIFRKKEGKEPKEQNLQ